MSATHVEDGNAPAYRREDEYTSEVLFDAISSISPLAGLVNDGHRFSNHKFFIHTDIGREQFGRGMTALWRSKVDEPDAVPKALWQLFSKTSFTACNSRDRAGRCSRACHGEGSTLQGDTRQCRPRV